MADKKTAQLEAWKQKYYDSVEDADQKERHWRRMDDVLRKTISRLTLAADGLDAGLDRELKALRDAIRDRVDDRTLETRIGTMSRTLAKLDTGRQQPQQQSPQRAAIGAVEVLQRLLEQTAFPRGNARRIKQLNRRLEGTAEEDVAAAIEDLASLFSQLLKDNAAPASETGGMLSRLFGGSRAADADKAKPPEAPPPRRSEAEIGLDAQRDLLIRSLDSLEHADTAAMQALRTRLAQARADREIRELAMELVTGQQPPPASAAAEDGVEGERVGGMDAREIFLQLLERMALPEAFDDRVDALQTRLESADDDFDSVDVLREIADMVSEVRSELQQEKQETEAFLHQLTERLQDVDRFVNGTESARQTSFEQGQQLGEAVQEHVRGIETEVQTAEELGTLKDAVQSRIDTIVKHVEEHRREEQARHREVDSQVEILQERLRFMEKETEELRQHLYQQRRQAYTDALTGVPNRLAWDERVQQEYARWQRFHTPLALLAWDVDNFKAVNDHYGHKAGDKVLKVIATLLEENIRETDFLARYGGEEFVMLVTGAGVEDVQLVAEKLRDAIEHCGFHYRGEQVPVTISCGISLFTDGDTVERVFERADKALYQAKEQGRNRCVMASADMTPET